jgi:hypothetical protein
MKKVIIVSPHFPPSNLAAVHRSRLFAMHLPAFGWEPIIVTVHHKYYEEALDWNLVKLLPKNLRIEKVAAIPTKPFRIIGDIGIRGFVPLLMHILRITKKEKIDFIYIPIPANFASLLGRLIHALTGIPYGIDYIDPWVHDWPGSNNKFSKHWFSRKLGDILEPIAVKNASLITGVAPGYYKDVLERNPHLKELCVTAAMPYGGEKQDHVVLKRLALQPYLFKKSYKIDLVYAGAMLPKAFKPLEAIFQSITNNKELYQNIRFHFIGTGKSPNDAYGYNIKSLAERYGLWQSIVFEYPKRIPYLDVLIHLNEADGIFILGSTEPHYTPSKVYQGILSDKPVFAVLHKESSACKIIQQSKAGYVLAFNGESDTALIAQEFSKTLTGFLSFIETFNPSTVDRTSFEEYSAYNVSRTLATALDMALRK